MIHIRRSEDRGHFDHGWLETYHTFSFADYFDPAFMGFRSLRVINDDRVAPGEGFPTHPHMDMEIVTYVLSGELAHKDSLGTGSVIRPGEIQRMSAGTGIRHSEFNSSRTEPLHLLQIWILPERRGIVPGYEQKRIAQGKGFILIASKDPTQDSVVIHQDARIYSARLKKGETADFSLDRNRHAWVQMAGGRARLNEHALGAGDGAAISQELSLSFLALEDSEILLFDLA